MTTPRSARSTPGSPTPATPTRSRPGPRKSTSTTSSSTARSASSATAPAWSCPPWTWWRRPASRSAASSPPTSSTSAAARPPRSWPTAWKSCCPTRACAASWSTSSAGSPPATRWPTGSSRRWACSPSAATQWTGRSWSGWTATTRPRAGAFSRTRPSARSSRWEPWTARRAGRPNWRREHEMAIFLTGQSRVMIQGITGSEGRRHGARMLAAGTRIVGGTNPRKAGQTVELNGTEVPVFGTVADTMAATGADVSVIFVPAERTKDAVIEAIEAQIPLCIVITEGIPVHDTAEFWARASAAGNQTRIIGPNCPGVASPGKSNAGIIPADITSEGRIGLVSKSGTLTYQMMYELRDIGFSTAVGIGGDPVIGTTHIDCLQAFAADPETDAIVMIGEIGGDAEERAAAFIEQHVTKPVVAYVAGFTAPEGKTMGHAGAIVSGSSGTAQAKKEALEKVGVRVGRTPSETALLVREAMPAP